MKKLLLSVLLLSVSGLGWAKKDEPLRPAPDFAVTGVDGNKYSLSDLKGKTVVLEWWNQDCPYVRKHYGSGSMQKLQAAATGEGVVWLTILSSAPGKQGFLEADKAKAAMAAANGKPTTIVLDPQGELGKKYGAKTTPHMYVINKENMLAYAGAIDSIDTSDQADIAKATNYVTAALTSVKVGQIPAMRVTKAYGCSVKY
jgi:hypothetical protein